MLNLQDFNEDDPTLRKLGKFWVALHNEEVIGLIAMRVPYWVDHGEYRDKAREILAMLSPTVRKGHIYVTSEGYRFFVRDRNHPNRGKGRGLPPKPPRIYPLAYHL